MNRDMFQSLHHAETAIRIPPPRRTADGDGDEWKRAHGI